MIAIIAELTNHVAIFTMELLVWIGLFSMTLELKYKDEKILVGILGLFLGWLIGIYFLPIENINRVSLLSVGVICCLIFKGKWLYKCFMLILGLCVSAILEIGIVASLSIVLKSDFKTVYYDKFLAEIVVQIIKLIVTGSIVLGLKKYFYQKINKYYNHKIKAKQILFFMVLPTASLIMTMALLDEIIKINGGNLLLSFSIAMVVCLLIFNFTMLVLIEKEYENTHYQQVNAMIKKQLETQFKHYESLQTIHQGTRALKHDMKNHIMCIGSLVEMGNLEAMQEYIKKITMKLEQLDLEIRTGDAIADAVLSEKAMECKEKNIRLEIEGGFCKKDKIDPIDRCTLLANAMDNAIEACSNLPEHIQKYVHVNILCHKEHLFITIKNPIIKQERISNNSIKTSKCFKQHHGYGIDNMQKCVEKYEGNFKISYEDNIFVLEAVFGPSIYKEQIA